MGSALWCVSFVRRDGKDKTARAGRNRRPDGKSELQTLLDNNFNLSLNPGLTVWKIINAEI